MRTYTRQNDAEIPVVHSCNEEHGKRLEMHYSLPSLLLVLELFTVAVAMQRRDHLDILHGFVGGFSKQRKKRIDFVVSM